MYILNEAVTEMLKSIPNAISTSLVILWIRRKFGIGKDKSTRTILTRSIVTTVLTAGLTKASVLLIEDTRRKKNSNNGIIDTVIEYLRDTGKTKYPYAAPGNPAVRSEAEDWLNSVSRAAEESKPASYDPGGFMELLDSIDFDDDMWPDYDEFADSFIEPNKPRPDAKSRRRFNVDDKTLLRLVDYLRQKHKTRYPEFPRDSDATRREAQDFVDEYGPDIVHNLVNTEGTDHEELMSDFMPDTFDNELDGPLTDDLD